MTDAPTRAELPLVPWRDLAPYLSVVVIESTADDPAITSGAVVRELRKLPPANSKRHTRQVAADEAAAADHRQLEGLGTLDAAGVDQLAGYVNEVGAVPSWLTERTELLNTTYELGLVVPRGNLIAVKPDDRSTTFRAPQVRHGRRGREAVVASQRVAETAGGQTSRVLSTAFVAVTAAAALLVRAAGPTSLTVPWVPGLAPGVLVLRSRRRRVLRRRCGRGRVRRLGR